MESIYYHVGDLNGYEFDKYENWPRIPKRSFENEKRKQLEDLLEKYRKDNDSCEFSRLTSLFVARTKEEAKEWAIRKKGHGQKCYLYTLSYFDKVSWHRADYYDRVDGILHNDGTPYQLKDITNIDEAAKLYWEEVTEFDNNQWCYEGLIEGEPLIIKKEQYTTP